MPTSTLRDLITRYAKWQEAGGVRQSIMISNRRGSLSNEDNDTEIDHEGDVIAWDFDTSFQDVTSTPSSLADEPKPFGFPPLDYSTDSLNDTLVNRPLRSASQGQSTIISSTGVLPALQTSMQHSTEHPLEQLFNDGTVRPTTAAPPLRARKDTLPSRPVSPLPPLAILNTQPSGLDSESRPGTALSTTSFDLRLPDIASTAPIQIEIPATEETLRKDSPGIRSRSATVTRSTRSDSAGSAGYPGRIPRHNTAEPMPQAHSPPRSNRAMSPMPISANSNNSSISSKSQAPPMSPPKSVLGIPPIPPTSPTKAQHIPSKSAPVNSALPVPPSSSTAPIQDNNFMKARSADLKTPRPPNLTLNVKTILTFAKLSYHRHS